MMPRCATIVFVLLFPGLVWAQNPYYDHGTYPAPGTSGSSAAMRAELDLIEAGFAKLPTLSGNANKVVVVNGSATALTTTDAIVASGTAFPVSPGLHALFLITDDPTVGSCTSSGGSAVTLCRWNGSAWEAISSGASAQGLDANFDIQKQIDGANNDTNAFIWGDGTRKIKNFCDVTNGCVSKPEPLADSTWRCWANFNCLIRDEEAGANILTIDPDAASKNAMYQFGANYKPLASFPVTLYPRGAAVYTEASIVSNQPKGSYIQVTDADTDAVDFRFVVTGKMVGITTATIRLYGVSKNASPANNIVFNCAMRANRPGTDTYTAHSTTGEQAITLTPATQNRPVSAVTPAITINGTVAEFAEIEGSCEVNATSTTSTQLTDFFLRAEALVQLVVNSISD